MDDYVEQAMRSLKDAPTPPGPAPELITATVSAMHKTEAVSRNRVPVLEKLIVNRWLGVAAIVALALVGVFTFLELDPGLESIAWADVAERVLQIQTVSLTVREHWGTVEIMIKEPRYLRGERDNGEVLIVDWAVGRSLSLNPHTKQAFTWEIKPGTKAVFDLYDWIRNLRDGTEVPVGEKVLNNRKVLGFRVAAPMPASGGTENAEVIVWVDSETELPVQIDGGADAPLEGPIVTNINFGVELDDALFDMTIPEGYTVRYPEDLTHDFQPAPDAHESLICVPLIGLGDVRFGMTRERVTEILGEPDAIDGGGNIQNLLYLQRGIAIGLRPGQGVLVISCASSAWADDKWNFRDFAGQTDQGIGIGAASDEIIAAYGEPDDRQPRAHGAIRWRYTQLKITFDLDADGKLTGFSILAP